MATLSLLSLHDDALTATLARARLTDHCALAATCKRVRRLILGKSLSVVRDRDGWTEYGIFALARTSDDGDDNTDIPSESLQFCCLSHKFDSNRDNIGPDGVPQAHLEFWSPTATVSEEGLLVVAGNWDDKKGLRAFSGSGEIGREVGVFDSRLMCWLSRPMLRARRLPEQLPERVSSTCIAFVQGRLVVAGGQSAKRRPGNEAHYQPLLSSSNCFAWDSSAALWEQLPPMPVPTEEAAYGVIGSRLYVVGGSSVCVERHPPGYRMPSLQILDMETRSWTKGLELDALHVISRQSAREFGNGHTREWSACGWRGRLYVVGCEPGYAHDEEEWGMHEGDDWYNETTEVYCFDPATNSWSTLPPLRFAMREGAGLCVHHGRLVVFGQGRTTMGGEFSRPLHGLIHYLSDKNTWEAWANSASRWIWTLGNFDKFPIMASPFNHCIPQGVVSLPLR